MESHYVGDGWYFDKATQRDYYTLWGFHFYSLIYAAVMGREDPERCARFVERARLIAPRFACWFDGEGRALPYGRSLTYRFAQCSFWAAMAFAGVTAEGLGWDEIKGLLLRNLRAWLRLPIFDRDGVLTVGYGYPNLCISEGYNAPGSPYLGAKGVFCPGAAAGASLLAGRGKALHAAPAFLDEHVRLLLTRDPENRQVVAYTAGNHASSTCMKMKSTRSLPTPPTLPSPWSRRPPHLAKGAYDSMLAVKRVGRDLWHARSGCDSFCLEEDRIRFTWRPMEGVTIRTVIAPWGMWHVRKHVIHSDYPWKPRRAPSPCPRTGRAPVLRPAAQLSACGRGLCRRPWPAGYQRHLCPDRLRGGPGHSGGMQHQFAVSPHGASFPAGAATAGGKHAALRRLLRYRR